MVGQASAAELREWTKRAEEIQVGKALQYFRQDVGLKFDKRRLSRLEAETVTHSKEFVKKFGREPEVLFLISASDIGYAKTLKLYLKLHEVRTSKIVSQKHKVNGAPVNWGSWRQFAAGTDDSKARKEVFDTFLRKSALIAPLIKARFDGFAEAMAELGTDPLTNYLRFEGVNYEPLASFVDGLGNSLRPRFREAIGRYSQEILGREAEYYDDYYFFRARVFRKYAERFPVQTDPVVQIVSTMKEMGLSAGRVKVDSADRRGKNASAFCAAIKVPTDVRISYRKSGPLENFTGVFHEFGHGIHASSIARNAPYGDKYGVAMGVAEIFSIFFENLMNEKDYLRRKLGLSDAVASDLVERFRFNTLFFAAFYSANSIMKLRYWREGLSLDQATRLYAEMTGKYMEIRYPGEYWLLHHVMPEYTLYSPSYLLAAVRAFELRNALRSKFGDRYWEEKGSGRFLLGLMAPGRGIELGRFSRLDAGSYAKSLSGDAS